MALVVADENKERISVRVQPSVKGRLKELASLFGKSQTSVVERGIDRMYERVGGGCNHTIRPVGELYTCTKCHEVFDAATRE